MNTLPKDPMLLLSVVNTRLRDIYPDLASLCRDLDADEEEIRTVLGAIDYEYDAGQNRFI
ncbi:MAG TPA: DUF4250 domain-containing protein [Lachnospiraceae bacterium]|nr:DUF4250 domain-containing protein [Lachnospiraceae bacterium]